MTQQTAFVGTYTDGRGEGLSTCRIDPKRNATITYEDTAAVTENPSFLAIHPTHQWLYAIHEVAVGRATAFDVGSENHRLRELNRTETGASRPCHCHVHPSGAFLMVAHYGGAAVSILPILSDGSLGSPTEILEHDGSGAVPERQSQPHPHSIVPSPDGQFVYVPDLGTDEIVVYEFDERSGALDRTSTVETRPGAGPRHLDFHPNGGFAYVTNELDSTVSAFEVGSESGQLRETETIATLPDGFGGDNLAADVQVHPSGKWLYASNRGHDSIAIFEIDLQTGKPTNRGYESTRGEWPRHFTFDSTGGLLLVENRHTDEIVSFEIDDRTGLLEDTRDRVEIPEPVCLQLL